MATTIMPPMTHQITGLPVLLLCSASVEVSLTLLPEASNSSRPRASEELSSPEESSEDASLPGSSLPDISEEEGAAEFGVWLEEGACSDGVWLAGACADGVWLAGVCGVVWAGVLGSGSYCTVMLVTKSPEPEDRPPTVI